MRTQALDDFPVVRLFEEMANAAGNDRPHVRHLQQCLLVGSQQGIEPAEMACQILGRGFAHMADAQAVDEAGQRGMAAFFQAVEQILCGLFGHAVQPGQGVELELVQVGQAVDQAAVDQLVDQLFTEVFDIHGAALGKVQHGLLALGAAEQAGRAASIDLAFLAAHSAAADRAGIGHGERHRALGPAIEHHGDHFGDHITGAAHHHGIANAHVLAACLFLVVEGGIGDRHTAHEDRSQLGHRSKFAGAANLHVDGLHGSELLLRRVLVRHGPARLAADEAQALLQRQCVDLVDHTVDVERQAVAQRGDLLVKFDQFRRAGRHRAVIRHRQAEPDQRIQDAAVGFGHGIPALHLAVAVGIEAQRAAGGNGGIELTQGAGSRVARIDEGFLVACAGGDLLALTLVQGFEIIAAHEDFAAHFEHLGHGAALQAQRNLAQRADVLRHVLASFAIAARGALHQHAVLVPQRNSQSIEFQFGFVFDGRVQRRQAQFLAHAHVEGNGAAGFRVRFGADGEHGHGMAHRGKSGQDLAQDTLGGRIRRAKLGMGFFECLQFLEQAVVLGIGQLGGIQRVVQMGVMLQLRAQRCGALLLRGRGAGSVGEQVLGGHAESGVSVRKPERQTAGVVASHWASGTPKIRRTGGGPVPSRPRNHAAPACCTGLPDHWQWHPWCRP